MICRLPWPPGHSLLGLLNASLKTWCPEADHVQKPPPQGFPLRPPAESPVKSCTEGAYCLPVLATRAKRSKFRKHAIFHSHPLLLLPQAQIHFPDSCGQLQSRSETAEVTGLGVEWGFSISAEHTLAFFIDFCRFSWVSGEWKWGGHGKYLSPVTWGCLLLATHHQPVTTIMVLSHSDWTSLAGLQPMHPSWSIWKRFESLRQESSLLHFKICWNLAAWVLAWLHKCTMHFLKVNCSPFGIGSVDQWSVTNRENIYWHKQAMELF